MKQGAWWQRSRYGRRRAGAAGGRSTGARARAQARQAHASGNARGVRARQAAVVGIRGIGAQWQCGEGRSE